MVGPSPLCWHKSEQRPSAAVPTFRLLVAVVLVVLLLLLLDVLRLLLLLLLFRPLLLAAVLFMAWLNRRMS